MGDVQPITQTKAASLHRTLGLWNLIIIGMVIIQPVAPMGIYGVISNKAHGHVVTTILIAMVAMLFTAISYGRMARIYPSAGSAYTYVGQEMHSALGYVVGWGMVMDYLINPLICTAICAKLTMNIIPGISFYIWVLLFAVLFTWTNLRGVKTSARMNEVLCAGMVVVVVLFLACSGPRRVGRTSRSWLFYASILRAGQLSTIEHLCRHFGCGAHLHWLRCDLHFLRGGKESAAQYHAGDSAGLSRHRSAFGA